ncbi:uncharacterized protein LOC112342029 [Selaginella moellendorffii]|uniref:uncharacterized protein LOC112342029 n=1 Tax=Selaginella moellendorffii TaxID=88036 RepID=UPI000D1C7299|nr:uncharacterized protein LOC112342029 [Selaginella moellendorffii]|eukprot:XP_024518942.1 uncharacterized protein LOC112342029 [Selaginella moellendorffii]
MVFQAQAILSNKSLVPRQHIYRYCDIPGYHIFVRHLVKISPFQSLGHSSGQNGESELKSVSPDRAHKHTHEFDENFIAFGYRQVNTRGRSSCRLFSGHLPNGGSTRGALVPDRSRRPQSRVCRLDFYHLSAPHAAKNAGLGFWPGNAAWAAIEFHVPKLLEMGEVPVKEGVDKLISYIPGMQLRSQDIPLFMHDRDFQKVGESRDVTTTQSPNLFSWTIMFLNGDLARAIDFFAGMLLKNAVAATIMIVTYGQEGDVDSAKMVFDRALPKNLVCCM